MSLERTAIGPVIRSQLAGNNPRDNDEQQSTNRRHSDLITPNAEIDRQLQDTRFNQRATNERAENANNQVTDEPAATQQHSCYPAGNQSIEGHNDPWILQITHHLIHAASPPRLIPGGQLPSGSR